MKTNRLQARIGYQFNDTSLLTRALSHRSIGKQNNERLEFIGDALLGVIIGEVLYLRFPSAKEGQLTQLRSSLVKGETLAEMGREFNLGENLLLGEGELKSGGFRRSSILEGAVESLIGAIYLDTNSDFVKCKTIILKWFESRIAKLSTSTSSKDYKTRLQEHLQNKSLPLPSYNVVNEKGDAHEKTFTISCRVDALKLTTQATGVNKRTAEKSAAELMLAKMLAYENCAN